MVKLFESDDYFMHSVVVLFLLINFNLQIGTIYLFMALVDWMAYYLAFDKNVFNILPIEKKKPGRFESLVWAMGAYVAFIFILNFINTRFLMVDIGSFESTFEYISSLIATTFSATPILYGSKYLRLAVWGILIAMIETRFFFRTLLQWGVHSTGIKFPSTVFSQAGIMISLFFGALFAVFHLVAKGITNNSALMATFVFGAISAGMVIHFKQILEALFLHIITNTIATMQQLQIGFFAPGVSGINSGGIVVLGGVLLVSWLLIFQEIPFIKPRRALG